MNRYVDACRQTFLTPSHCMVAHVHSDGFNRMQTERPHQAPLKYIKKCPPPYTRNCSISS